MICGISDTFPLCPGSKEFKAGYKLNVYSILHHYLYFHAAARWAELTLKSKSYLCVCARHFYRKPIQMFRTTRVVSRMARRVMIDVRRVRKAIRMVKIPRMVTVPWMVTIPRTDTICSQDVLNYLEYRR